MTIRDKYINKFNSLRESPLREIGKTYIFWIIMAAFLMAFLEFGQDYISSVLNNKPFSLVESLSYKLFWFIFIPFSMLLIYWLKKIRSYASRTLYLSSNAVAVLLITFIHLLVFSLLLKAISSLFYEEPWPIKYLLTEKLSTRLYISLSYYIILSAIFHLWSHRKADSSDQDNTPLRHIPVKNGRSTTLVSTAEIHWIQSDGPYLTISTEQKEHVILGSLKNIINDLPDNFKRIHRSTIVNIDHIKTLKSRGNGDYDVAMNCDATLRLSRNYAKPLRGLLL